MYKRDFLGLNKISFLLKAGRREVFTQFKKPNLKPNSNSDSINCEEYFFEINKIKFLYNANR